MKFLVCANTPWQAAETGSGKTGAFGIPLLQLVIEIRRKALLGQVHVPRPKAAGGMLGLSLVHPARFSVAAFHFVPYVTAYSTSSHTSGTSSSPCRSACGPEPA